MRDLSYLQNVLKQEPFNAVERGLVSHLSEDWGENNPLALFAAACASLEVREGHTFFDLKKRPRSLQGVRLDVCPVFAEWESALKSSPLVSLGDADPDRPLVLEAESSLYLNKYYNFEREVARLILERAEGAKTTEELPVIQKAANSRFFVITGGPGTGKTTLALRYLNKVLTQWKLARRPRFVAVAPTGKAAARLHESITSGLSRLELNQENRDLLEKVPCLTIHRLLGSLPFRTRFRHDERNPVPFDLIIIDESSMIDLPLMLRLFRGLSSTSQVLMLGDRDQLSSVEVGTVFSDILEAAESSESHLSHLVEHLSKTYRFSEDSTIYKACQFAKSGDSEGFARLLESRHHDWSFHALAETAHRIPASLVESGFRRWKELANCETPSLALQLLSEHIILTPARNGAFGSNEINRQVITRICRQMRRALRAGDPVHALPIIVLENDYESELFNGDMGLIWQEDDSGFAAFFPGNSGEARRFRVTELPRFDHAFALTIHKSQGSEFAQPACVFGPDPHGTLSRELIYTAFSRAKTSLQVYAHPQALLGGIERKVERATRLSTLLR